MKKFVVSQVVIAVFLAVTLYFLISVTKCPVFIVAVPFLYVGLTVVLSRNFLNSKQTPTKSVNALMMSVVIKLLFSSALCAVFIYLDKDSKVASVLSIFAIYLVNSILLIRFYLKN